MSVEGSVPKSFSFARATIDRDVAHGHICVSGFPGPLPTGNFADRDTRARAGVARQLGPLLAAPIRSGRTGRCEQWRVRPHHNLQPCTSEKRPTPRARSQIVMLWRRAPNRRVAEGPEDWWCHRFTSVPDRLFVFFFFFLCFSPRSVRGRKTARQKENAGMRVEAGTRPTEAASADLQDRVDPRTRRVPGGHQPGATQLVSCAKGVTIRSASRPRPPIALNWACQRSLQTAIAPAVSGREAR